MRRFSALPKNVVGCVDCVADWPLIEQPQPRCDLIRRCLYLSRANLASSEPRTKFRLLNLNRDLGLALRSGQSRLDPAKREIVER